VALIPRHTCRTKHTMIPGICGALDVLNPIIVLVSQGSFILATEMQVGKHKPQSPRVFSFRLVRNED
jgi:hypothetical protein